MRNSIIFLSEHAVFTGSKNYFVVVLCVHFSNFCTETRRFELMPFSSVHRYLCSLHRCWQHRWNLYSKIYVANIGIYVTNIGIYVANIGIYVGNVQMKRATQEQQQSHL